MDALLQQIGIQDLTGTFTIADVAIGLALSFVLTAFIGYVYQFTHKGTSYTQSYVHTLVLLGMVVAVIMMIVGSNIARAFALVGALSIIRFRNAVKETRDVGFIFFAMAVGMAMGTKFYLLGIVTTIVVSLAILIMSRFDLYRRHSTSHVLKVHVNNDVDFEHVFDDVFAGYTGMSELISAESAYSGALTELVYNVTLKHAASKSQFVSDLKTANGNLKVSLLVGYNAVDL